MLSFVLQSIKSHVFANFEDMGTVVFEDFLQMIESMQTKFLTFVDEFQS